MTATKIVTCNYCGTRAALRVSEGQRHELVCSNCGAPLQSMKTMPAESGSTAHGAHPAGHHYAARPGRHIPSRRSEPPRKSRKKKKSRRRRLFEELWDIAEDIFD